MQQAAEGTRLGARREREGMPGPGGSRGPESRAAPGEPGGAGTPPRPAPQPRVVLRGGSRLAS